MSLIVLIAAPEHLETLKSRPDLASAQAFPANEALRALDVITRQRPAVVALERAFAASSRGVALINRIKADPALIAADIQIVSSDGEMSRVTSGTTVGSAAASGAAGVAVAPAPTAAPAGAPLDQRGTRRAPRFRMVEGVDVTIDGNTATLVDLSAVGAMVISPTILRPNQRVRFALPDQARALRFSAAVAWAAFEMPKGGPRYRAGIEFLDADAAAVGRFIDTNKQP